MPKHFLDTSGLDNGVVPTMVTAAVETAIYIYMFINLTTKNLVGHIGI